MRLIDADALKEQFTEGAYTSKGVREIIDNAPTVNPCHNCDLYFKAMTKEEMEAYIQKSCYTCKHKVSCPKSAVCQDCRGFCNYEKGGADNENS